MKITLTPEQRRIVDGRWVERPGAYRPFMTYTFGTVSAAVALKVEGYYPQTKRSWVRLQEKNGKLNEMPCHHKLENYLDEYLHAAAIGADRKGPLFRTATGKTGQLTGQAMTRADVYRMIQRRARDCGIATHIGCHTFRATGIADYLKNGGRIDVAQKTAGHSNGQDDRPLRPACDHEVGIATTESKHMPLAPRLWSGEPFGRYLARPNDTSLEPPVKIGDRIRVNMAHRDDLTVRLERQRIDDCRITNRSDGGPARAKGRIQVAVDVEAGNESFCTAAVIDQSASYCSHPT